MINKECVHDMRYMNGVDRHDMNTWVWMKMNMICIIWLKKGIYDMMHEIENKMEMVVIAWKN